MKKTFLEIINNKLIGQWCDGIALLTLDKENILTIENIYSETGTNISGYPIELERKFSKVDINVGYADAILELIKNNKTIITTKGNVVSKTNKGRTIILNDCIRVKTVEELLYYISKEEIQNDWIVF